MSGHNQLEANKQTVRAYLTALCAGDGPGLEALITEDAVISCTGTGIVSRTRGREEFIQVASGFKNLLKNGLHLDIRHMTAEDDRVSVEADGTSELNTGEAYNNQYHFLFFVRDGKVCRVREYLCTKLAEEVIGPAKRRAAEAAEAAAAAG